MSSRWKLSFGVFLVCACFVAGCSTNLPETTAPISNTVSRFPSLPEGYEVLGQYKLFFDGSSDVVQAVPCRDLLMDKEYVDENLFPTSLESIGFKPDPTCPNDWLAGDITFRITIENNSGTDYYDVWAVLFDTGDAEILDPASWVTTFNFSIKYPYIAFATDDPECALPAGGVDSQVHHWHNPCDHPVIYVDMVIVGKPYLNSVTPTEIELLPPVVKSPIWDPLETYNFKARINDHQKDCSVLVRQNNIGIPTTFPLYDDGHHGDDAPNDGLFATGTVPFFQIPYGQYDVWLQAISANDNIQLFNKYNIQVAYVDPSWDELRIIATSNQQNQLGVCKIARDSEGRLHFAWIERYDWGGTYVFMCKYRTWFEGEFTDTVLLNSNQLKEGYPLPNLANPQIIVTPEDDVYVIFYQWNPNYIAHVSTYCSTNPRGVWAQPVLLSGTPVYSMHSPHAVYAPYDDRVYVVAEDYRNSTYGVCMTSTEAGLNDWEPATRLFISPADDYYDLDTIDSLVAGDGGDLYFAFSEYQSGGDDSNVYFTKIDTDSKTASPPVRVSDLDSANGRERHACLWKDPAGEIGIAWAGLKDAADAQMSIYFDLSDDGNLWGLDKRIYKGTTTNALLPVVKPYGPRQWGISLNHDHTNFFMVSFDGGMTFSDPEVVQSPGSCNLGYFIVTDGFETWHTWRSNYVDVDYNIYLNRRFYE